MNTKNIQYIIEFCGFIFNDYESNYIFLSENAVNVSYQKIEETLSLPTQTNIAIAAFTTAYAGLRSLKELDLLGGKAIRNLIFT